MRTRYTKKKSVQSKRRLLEKLLLSIAVALILSSLAWFQDTLTTSTLPQTNDPPALYSNQTRHDLRQTMIKAIDEAKESIMLVVFSLTDPYLIETLRKKGEEGIRIHVVCDAKASPYIDRKLGSKITVIRRFGPGLMHQKILVIDKKQTWIGSANMTTESLQMHGNLVTAINNNEFAEAVVAKAITLEQEGKGLSFPHEEFLINGQKVELWFLPDNPKAVQQIKGLIASAKKSLRIAMFTWTRFDLAQAVIDASKRGVKTEVVIDHSSAKGASAKIVQLLKKHGIPTSLSQGKALLHHKFALIDNNILINGSANWTKAAFSQNDDCFIVLHDLIPAQRQQVDELWSVIKNESEPVN